MSDDSSNETPEEAALKAMRQQLTDIQLELKGVTTRLERYPTEGDMRKEISSAQTSAVSRSMGIIGLFLAVILGALAVNYYANSSNIRSVEFSVKQDIKDVRTKVDEIREHQIKHIANQPVHSVPETDPAPIGIIEIALDSAELRLLISASKLDGLPAGFFETPVKLLQAAFGRFVRYKRAWPNFSLQRILLGTIT